MSKFGCAVVGDGIVSDRKLPQLSNAALYLLAAVIYTDQMDFPRNEDIHPYNTRGALNYPLPTHRTTHFSKKPSYLGRKVLNSLPQNLRGNELKRRLQDWLVERPVYTINEFYNIVKQET
ncbi:hypothetical protein J6590_053218 [Homalodisca vitripennis]|nr:hypothetical protein J6590_053218 [Homalodisca vitripennis]